MTTQTETSSAEHLTPDTKKSIAVSLAALGVVYGDIGTSPLYAMKEIFSLGHHPVPVTEMNVLGILSLIVWALIMVVSFKYVMFIMRADNRGEGGIMALVALASSSVKDSNKARNLIMLLGIIGACMFYADGMITPAISVLSAVEGLEVAAPFLHVGIIPITLVVIFLLFWLQSKGTAIVGAFFGPVMLLWFSVLAILGVMSIVKNPVVLYAINPMYGFMFFEHNLFLAFITLGAVVLAVTGAEALYADMGHFGRKPIQRVWFFFVLPALIINYFGQGALILSDAKSIVNPFYLLAPSWMLFPLIILSTLAAVIASQAVISGAFSVSRQALQLGYIPRMQVLHTSESELGQVYIPRINWILMFAVMLLVLGFKSSGNLAAAYGIAVTGDMVITTLLAGVVFHLSWGWSLWRTGLLVVLFLIVDLAFFSANILKIPDGGWVPLLIGAIIFTLMLTWKKGRQLLFMKLRSEAMALEPFIEAISAHPPARVQGNAIFMTPNMNGVPHAMLHNLKHNKVLHEKVILLTVRNEEIPHIAPEDRLTVEVLPSEFYRVIIHYGFKDAPDVPLDMQRCAEHGLILDEMDTSYFIGKESLIAVGNSKMPLWRVELFSTMFKGADSITDYFKLPANRVVELGSQVTL